MTARRRDIPPHLLALILNHLAGWRSPTPSPTNFCEQFVARQPGHELSEVLSRAFARANALLLEGTETLAAQLHEAAIGRTLIATHQLRLRDLAAIDIDRHLVRDRDGRIQRIQMSGQEASSPLGIDVPLSNHFAALMTQHLHTFRPKLPGAEHSTKLFPSCGKSALDIHELRARLRLVELMSHPTTAGE